MAEMDSGNTIMQQTGDISEDIPTQQDSSEETKCQNVIDQDDGGEKKDKCLTTVTDTEHENQPSPTPSTLEAQSSQIEAGPGLLFTNKGKLREQQLVVDQKKKDDEKLTIYKSLAIKLKKELVKTREELLELKDVSKKERDELTSQLKTLEGTLNSERISNSTSNASLESAVKSLKIQLSAAENDLQSLQTEFESYKTRASQLMQQTNYKNIDSNQKFDEAKYKQVKELNDEYKARIQSLESQLSIFVAKNRELSEDVKAHQERSEAAREQLEASRALESKCASLSRENENLKYTLRQYREKLNVTEELPVNRLAEQVNQGETVTEATTETGIPSKSGITASSSCQAVQTQSEQGIEFVSQNSPIISQANSSPACSDHSSSGYVHIKPAAFEIISRSSVLEDAQNQIDNLTKAYLDSESTNSLLSDQVAALKEEIRRIQRGTERMDLAENLEYLKNIVLKFISLDSNNVEQRQRLVPVLSTVLKLSPDETARLNSLVATEKSGMASLLQKL